MSFVRQNKAWTSFLLFLLGLGSATKIYFIGTIALSELVIFFLAPIVLLFNINNLKRDGFMLFLYMLGFMTAGLFASSWWNRSPLPFVLKMFAIFYGFFAYYVVFYHLLRSHFRGLGWFYLGLFFSGIITIWALNPHAEVSSSGFAFVGNADVETVIRGPLFWIGKVRGLGQLPIIAAYLKTPLAYSVTTPIMFISFAMLTTITGRAQSMCVLIGGAMMFIGRKRRDTMKLIGKHIWTFALIGAALLVCYKAVYSFAAAKGYLGEAARTKYEQQTRQGTGIIPMLVSGRTPFFIALTAAVDHPIIGFGPRAEDRNGYAEKFLIKYGSYEDLEGYYYYKNIFLSHGIVSSIPTHSYIMSTWLWCGLPGLIFFLWMLYIIYRHIRFYLAAVPQWFGYFALTIPSIVWSIFFNPFGARYELPLLVVCMNFARAIGKGCLRMPIDMEMEVEKYK
jgi:hypothetical protein